MAKQDKRKLELMLDQAEVGGFLKRLAQGMETGVLEIGGQSMEIAGFDSLRVNVDQEEGLCRLKFKVKHPKADPMLDYSGGVFVGGDVQVDAPAPELLVQSAVSAKAAEPAASAEPAKSVASGRMKRPKYDSLKDRMDHDFKAIRSAVEQGRLPDKTVSDHFVGDSALMTTYAGKGDPHYAAYDAAVAGYVEAMATGDPTRVRRAVDELHGLKKRCHDEYK